MNHDTIRIGLEKSLKDELFDQFEGAIIKTVLEDADIKYDNSHQHLLHEGHGFRVTETLSPKIFKICNAAQEKLEFTEAVEFFIVNSAEVNACALLRSDEKDRHLISITSGLVALFDDEELQFVLGHEIGHLISRTAELSRVIQFVYPDYDKVPPYFRNRISLWNRVAELNADRYGYIASPNLGKCISNFFKLCSGMDTKRIAFNPENYLAETDRAIDHFKRQSFCLTSSHPVNPIRIKALQYFSKSKLMFSINSGQSLTDDPELTHQMDELLELLQAVGNTELYIHRMHFIASAGFLMASIDEHVTDSELEKLMVILGSFTMFPRKFLEHIANSGKIMEIFCGAVAAILEKNPGEKDLLFGWLIEMAMIDKDLDQNEIKLLYKIGQDILGFRKIELAQMIAKGIQKSFMPKLYR
ncbi:MAG: M48 family metalloprotease [Syntrophaceae bacterium]|nr:M48 family metalloprotease [Syntrophaceae bacterium]